VARINVLGFEIANLIAAGEVVDRPASVVKELLENSVDSGASVVTVEIKNGGIDFVRVSDNGSGISPEDLPIAVKRHATSKITGAEDLDHIMTLGFRGEALAAISSVTRIRILSKVAEAEMGALLESEGGEVVTLTETGCADGTTVIVEDLFYNTPARKKFLKKASIEATTVASLAEKIALSMPHIAIRLIIDGEMKFATSGDGSLFNAVYAVLGRDIARKMIEVNRSENGVTIQGFVSSPMLVKSTRNMQNFFINGRYVKSKTAAAAIEQAYESYIPDSKFPSCVMNIILDPSKVDVNVHPSKLEVKFSDEKAVFDAIFFAVRTSLESKIARPELEISERQKKAASVTEMRNLTDAFTPKKFHGDIEKTKIPLQRKIETADEGYPPSTKTPTPNEIVSANHPNVEDNFFKTIPSYLPFLDISTAKSVPENEKGGVIKNSQIDEKSLTDNITTISKLLNLPESEIENKSDVDTQNEVPEYYIIGEAYNSYVILQLEDRLLMIDKHAAHERIIFEDLKKSIRAGKNPSQFLMIPIKVEVSQTEAAAVSEYASEIIAMGFNFNIEDSAIYITEIPDMIETVAAHGMMEEFARRLVEGTGGVQTARDSHFEKALYQASCKAAIKAGRIYDRDHIKWICAKVLSLDDIKVCPHGRPVAFDITKTSIERQFKRIN